MHNDPSKWRNKKTYKPYYFAAIKLLNKNFDKKNILELGSGLGEFAEVLQKNNFNNLTLVDGSKEYVKRLKKISKNSFQMDFNKKLNFKDNSFDIVISLEVIEHIEKAEFLLQEIGRVLKKGGCLILSTPNFSFLPYRFRYLLGKQPHQEGYHVRHFNYYTLLYHLNNHGFKFESSYSLSPVPYLNRLLLFLSIKPIYLKIDHFQNLFAQDLVFKVIKK